MSPFKHILVAAFVAALSWPMVAQDCDPDVPVMDVDMSGDANAYSESPWVQRVGNCCSTSSPDL